jgi:hypothetical protein
MFLAFATVSLLMITISCDKDKKDEPTDLVITEECYLPQMVWEEDNDGYQELITYNSEGKIIKVTMINDDIEILPLFIIGKSKK